MKTIEKPWIKLKETIDKDDYYLINKLQEQCIYEDKTSLKLELDYKLGDTCENRNISSIKNINEFMYFDGLDIIGYIGICSFGSKNSPIEVNGMVKPEYRNQGVFKTLVDLVIDEWKKRNLSSILLLSDKNSNSGQQCIKKIGAKYKHSEYEMYLSEDKLGQTQDKTSKINLRKAINADATEVARQNLIYFSAEFQNCKSASDENALDISSTDLNTTILDEDMVLPEEEEKKGMIIYIAEKDEQIIGKVHTQLTSEVGCIYGLGVLPEYRSKGFGREILLMAISKLQKANANKIMLQVVVENSNALNLYKSCGFIETSTMDYYEIKS